MNAARKNLQVPVNAAGKPIGARGEAHPRARLTDHEVELIRASAAERMAAGETLEVVSVDLAARFEVHPRTVVKYIYFERRARSAR